MGTEASWRLRLLFSGLLQDSRGCDLLSAEALLCPNSAKERKGVGEKKPQASPPIARYLSRC